MSILERHRPSRRRGPGLRNGLGDAVHLYERDCSIQRRHQKLLRKRAWPSLILVVLTFSRQHRVTRLNYRSAGTLEFLLAPDGSFYFGMNTRIQVEHPVSECITGLDLQNAASFAEGHNPSGAGFDSNAGTCD